MQKTRHERCPECGSKDVIKWGKQSGHQRYKCRGCGALFTFRRKDVKIKQICLVQVVDSRETDHKTGVRDKRIQRTSAVKVF